MHRHDPTIINWRSQQAKQHCADHDKSKKSGTLFRFNENLPSFRESPQKIIRDHKRSQEISKKERPRDEIPSKRFWQWLPFGINWHKLDCRQQQHGSRLWVWTHVKWKRNKCWRYVFKLQWWYAKWSRNDKLRMAAALSRLTDFEQKRKKDRIQSSEQEELQN